MKIIILNKDGDYLTEFTKIISLSLSEKVSNISWWNFEIPGDEKNINIENLRCFNFIKIYDNNKNYLFKWIITWLDITHWVVKIIFSNENYIWKKKILIEDKSYDSWKKISEILSENLDDINWRYDTWYSLDINTNATINDKLEFSSWYTYYDILVELSKIWFDFITRDWKIEFKELLWVDRTDSSNSDYFIYEYNIYSPTSNNVQDVKWMLDWKNISNYITWKDANWTYNKDDDDSIDLYWNLEESVSVDWNWDDYVSWQLENKKDWITDITIIPYINNYNDLWIWDKLKCRIIWENDLLNYDWFVKLIEKKYNVKEWENFQFVIKKISTETKDFIWQFNELKEKLKKLSIK